MKPGIKKIIEDAKEKGLTVKESDSSSRVRIYKNKSEGIDIWGDGIATVFYPQANLGILTAIRTQKIMRKVLGL